MHPDTDVELNKTEPIEEYSGNLARQREEDKLMKSVLENDKEVIEKGKLLNEALNNNLDSFVPDLMFKQLVNNYSLAEKLYGQSIIKLISGYNPNYVQKNITIPEFRRELKEKIIKTIEELKDKNLINADGSISEQGITLEFDASIVKEFARLGYDPAFGARPLRRVVDEKLRSPLSKKILEKGLMRGNRASVVMKGEEVEFIPLPN